MQRHRVGQAADVARDDRDRAELAHRAGVAEQHAVEQAPLDVRQRHAPEGLPAAGAERQRGLLLVRALLLHQRDQLARDEREGDEDRRQHDAGHGEDDLDVVRRPATAPNQPCAPNSSTKIRPAITGETENGRSISVISKRLAAELELGDRPGRGDAEDQVERHRDRRDEQRQPDRRPARRARRARRSRRRRPCASASANTDDQRQQQEQRRGRRARRAISSAAHPAAAPRGRGAERAVPARLSVGGHRLIAVSAMRRCGSSACSRLIDQQHRRTTIDQHHDGDRGGAGVVELLELDDDQQRRDLGHDRACCRR